MMMHALGVDYPDGDADSDTTDTDTDTEEYEDEDEDEDDDMPICFPTRRRKPSRQPP